MAKYTADQSLIRGAAKVAQSLRPISLKGLDPVIEKGQKIIQAGLAQKKAIDAALDKATSKTIMTAGALGDEFYNYTTDKVNGWRDMYYEGVRTGGTEGEKMKMDAMMQMQNWSTFVQNHKKWNEEHADLHKDGMFSNYMNEDRLHNMTKILNHEYTLGENKEGEVVFNIKNTYGEDVEVTQADYESYWVPKNYSVDETYKNLMFKYKTVQGYAFSDNDVYGEVFKGLPTNEDDYNASLFDSTYNLKEMLENDGSLDNAILASIAGEDFMDTIGDGDMVLDPKEKADFIEAATDPENWNYDWKISKEIMARQFTLNIRKANNEYRDAEDRRNKTGKYTPTDKEEEETGWVNSNEALAVQGGNRYVDYNIAKDMYDSFVEAKDGKATNFNLFNVKYDYDPATDNWYTGEGDDKVDFGNSDQFRRSLGISEPDFKNLTSQTKITTADDTEVVTIKPIKEPPKKIEGTYSNIINTVKFNATGDDVAVDVDFMDKSDSEIARSLQSIMPPINTDENPNNYTFDVVRNSLGLNVPFFPAIVLRGIDGISVRYPQGHPKAGKKVEILVGRDLNRRKQAIADLDDVLTTFNLVDVINKGNTIGGGADNLGDN